jgi:hypothetical protein
MRRPARTTPRQHRWHRQNLAEASGQLLEQSFNDGKFELADQLIAADAVNHDPAVAKQSRRVWFADESDVAASGRQQPAALHPRAQRAKRCS